MQASEMGSSTSRARYNVTTTNSRLILQRTMRRTGERRLHREPYRCSVPVGTAFTIAVGKFAASCTFSRAPQTSRLVFRMPIAPRVMLPEQSAAGQLCPHRRVVRCHCRHGLRARLQRSLQDRDEGGAVTRLTSRNFPAVENIRDERNYNVQLTASDRFNKV